MGAVQLGDVAQRRDDLWDFLLKDVMDAPALAGRIVLEPIVERLGTLCDELLDATATLSIDSLSL